MAAGQRRVLGTLFMFLAIFFVGIAAVGIQGGGIGWGIGLAALVIALWIGTLGLRVLLASRRR